MRVPKTVVYSLLLLLGTISIVTGNEIKFLEITNKEEWNDAFEKAKAENKLIFADIYTDWCTYCHKLDKEVYTNPEVVNYFNEHFINIKFDAETPFGYPMTERYDVSGYPKMLFLTTKQDVFESIDGFVPANVLMQYGRGVQDSWGALPELLTKYADGKLEREDQLRLIGILERSDREKAEILAETYIRGLKEADYEDIENVWLVSRFQNQLSGAPYQYISTHKKEMVAMHGEAEFGDYMKSIYNDNLNLAIKYEDPQLLEKLVIEVLPQFLEASDVPEAAFITKKLYYRERQELKKYEFEIKSYLTNHVDQGDKQPFLFQNALEIIETFEDTSIQNFAAGLLNQALEINPQNFEATALLGYTNGVLGNYKSADELLVKAKDLASNKDEKEMVDNLIEAISLMKTN